MCSQPASEGLQRTDQGGACRCQRSGVGKQLDEPFERTGRPALVWLRDVHCGVDLRESGARLGHCGIVEGRVRQRVPQVMYRAPRVLAGDHGRVLAALDHRVAVDVIDDDAVLVLDVDAHVALLMGPASGHGGSTGNSR